MRKSFVPRNSRRGIGNSSALIHFRKRRSAQDFPLTALPSSGRRDPILDDGTPTKDLGEGRFRSVKPGAHKVSARRVIIVVVASPLPLARREIGRVSCLASAQQGQRQGRRVQTNISARNDPPSLVPPLLSRHSHSPALHCYPPHSLCVYATFTIMRNFRLAPLANASSLGGSAVFFVQM